MFVGTMELFYNIMCIYIYMSWFVPNDYEYLLGVVLIFEIIHIYVRVWWRFIECDLYNG